MSSRVPLFIIAALLSLAGCAGSIEWGKCEPDVCGDSNDSLTISPGGSSQVTATLLVEGAYEDTYTLSVSSDPASGVTATITPRSAEVLDGVPLKATVTVSVDSAAMMGSKSVQIEAKSSDGANFASTALFVTVP